MKKLVRTCAAVGWLGMGALAAAPVMAQIANGPALYLEGGSSPQRGEHTDTATVGLRLPTDVRFFDGRVTLAVDAYLSQWRAKALPGERDHFWQLGLVPMFRWRFDEGRSPFFVEAGIGASYLLRDYRTVNREFGSRWNFSDHLGIGANFGAGRRHELGLYVKHVSNAGLKKPNPGETFWIVRYAYAL